MSIRRQEAGGTRVFIAKKKLETSHIKVFRYPVLFLVSRNDNVVFNDNVYRYNDSPCDR